MSDVEFYSKLPILDAFSEVFNLSNYTPVPDDWYVVVADVVNSTNAIHNGAYKAVNVLGVSIISSLLNSARPVELPYIFGGDGATLCVPEELLSECRQALIATRQLALNEFSLELRTGIISVAKIREHGHDVLVARHWLSKYCVQAAFTGGGIACAEALLKTDAVDMDRLFPEDGIDGVADYTGLECRWDDVPSQHGETISLIVKSLSCSAQAQARFYETVLKQLRNIFGDDEDCKPVCTGNLRPAFSRSRLQFEDRLKSPGNRGLAGYTTGYLLMVLQNVIGWLFMTLDITVGGTRWGHYKTDVVLNTDYRKFDGILREVISGTSDQCKKLRSWLQQQHENDQCVYGIHTSSSALITCLINNREGNHYHFIDGSNGGYALAAIEMKKQECIKGLSDRGLP